MRNRFFVHKLLLLCLLALFITSCATPEKYVSVACKSILEAEINPIVFNGIETGEINEWILQRYPIDPDTIEESKRDGIPRSQYVVYDWRYNNKQYGAIFTNNEFVALRVHFSEDLLGSDFTACLGEPDFYMVEEHFIHSPYLTLNLWYVDEGIIIHQIFSPDLKPFQRYTPEITKDTIFGTTRVFYHANTEIRAMISSLYASPQDPRTSTAIDEEMEALQVWDSWDNVRIR